MRAIVCLELLGIGVPVEFRVSPGLKPKLLVRDTDKTENEAVILVRELGPFNTEKKDLKGFVRSKRQKILENIPRTDLIVIAQKGGNIAAFSRSSSDQEI